MDSVNKKKNKNSSLQSSPEDYDNFNQLFTTTSSSTTTFNNNLMITMNNNINSSSTFSYLDSLQASSFLQDNNPAVLSTKNFNNPSKSQSLTTLSKPSKKRSRASRRAPTTVLTTDTSNFRAMVQEFTGVPSPPFSTSSSSSSLLKPYPHKFITNHLTTLKHQQQLPTTYNYQQQLPSSTSFQSLLQSQLAHNNNNIIISHTTTPPLSAAANTATTLTSSSLADYGSLAGAVIGSAWGQDDPTRLGCNAENNNNHSNKGGGGEGMLDSWICSSD